MKIIKNTKKFKLALVTCMLLGTETAHSISLNPLEIVRSLFATKILPKPSFFKKIFANNKLAAVTCIATAFAIIGVFDYFLNKSNSNKGNGNKPKRPRKKKTLGKKRNIPETKKQTSKPWVKLATKPDVRPKLKFPTPRSYVRSKLHEKFGNGKDYWRYHFNLDFPLHEACNWLGLEEVRTLVESYRLNVNSYHRSGHYYKIENYTQYDLEKNTPLHTTCSQNCHSREKVEIARYLLKREANPNLKNTYEQTPLALACSTGNLELVKLLFEHGAKCDPQEDADKPNNLLRIACDAPRERGNFEIIKFLVEEKGYDITQKTKDEETMLHFYMFRTPSKEIKISHIRYFLENGIDVNAKNNFGNTPLHWACTKRNFELIKFLVSQGADVNAKGQLDNTPLTYVSDNDYTNRNDWIKYLIENGADVNAKTTNGEHVLYNITLRDYYEFAKYLIKEKGADINLTFNAADGIEHNLLSFCFISYTFDRDFVKFLLENGADTSLLESKRAQIIGKISRPVFTKKNKSARIKLLDSIIEIHRKVETLIEALGSENWTNAKREIISLIESPGTPTYDKQNAILALHKRGLLQPSEITELITPAEETLLNYRFFKDKEKELENEDILLTVAKERPHVLDIARKFHKDEKLELGIKNDRFSDLALQPEDEDGRLGALLNPRKANIELADGRKLAIFRSLLTV